MHFRTQQIAPRIRRVWAPAPDGTGRLPDTSLSGWARAQVAGTVEEQHASLAEAATLAERPGTAVLLELEVGDDGAVRISGGLAPGERIYGAYDADAQAGMDRRGDHVHLVTELHPIGRHLRTDPCERCGSGPDEVAEHADDVAGAAADAPDPAAGVSAEPDALEIGTRKSSNYGELHLPVLYSSEGYAVFVANPHSRAILDVGDASADHWSFTAAGGPAEVYLLGPGTPAELVGLFTRLTGHQPLPPAWALGYIQSRFGYESFAHARTMLERADTEQIPVHGLVFDVQWLREHVDLHWNPDGFENPRENLAAIAAHGARTVVITEPGTRRDASNFAAGAEGGFFALDAAGEMYDSDQWYTRRGIHGYRPITPGQGALVNFFNEGAAEWWYSQHRPLLADGVDAWWFDLNEPEDITDDVVFQKTDWPAARPQIAGTEVRNVFALAQQRAFARRDREETSRRPFVLSRSGAAGSQRYGTAPWSGDVGATWEDLQRQPRLALTAGMCGIPLFGSDIGGFSGDPGPELFARWMQAGAFMPIMRAHGYMADREPWSQGAEAFEACRRVITLRAQLLPSIVTWAQEALAAGLPFTRPMLLDHPGDERFHTCDDQWMFGPLLVAPVLEEGQVSRTVDLPAGEWVDVWSGNVLGGGSQVTVEAGLQDIPLFVPRVTALVADAEPLARRGHNWPADELEVWSWAKEGQAAHATLWTDDGITRLHEEGGYCHQRVTVRDGALELERLGGGWPAAKLVVRQPHAGRVAAASAH